MWELYSMHYVDGDWVETFVDNYATEGLAGVVADRLSREASADGKDTVYYITEAYYELQTYHRNNFYQNTKPFTEDWVPKGSLSKEELDVKYSKYVIPDLDIKNSTLDLDFYETVKDLQQKTFQTIEGLLGDYFKFKFGRIPTQETLHKFYIKSSDLRKDVYGNLEYYYHKEELILIYDIRNFSYQKVWEEE
ncbi:hypothetical protein VP501E541_P0242 [Vibrio phage 501E54-1]|nr:hypothetical protein VP501E541_P0242 [Vibrio phage 501E54-1]